MSEHARNQISLPREIRLNTILVSYVIDYTFARNGHKSVSEEVFQIVIREMPDAVIAEVVILV